MKRRNFIRRSLGLILGSAILKMPKAPAPEKLFKDPKDVDWKQFYNCGGNKSISLPDIDDIPDIEITEERILTNEFITRHYTSEDYYIATH